MTKEELIAIAKDAEGKKTSLRKLSSLVGDPRLARRLKYYLDFRKPSGKPCSPEYIARETLNGS